ncbi:unnamed protein product [Peniophora sp. CBMAI 1063]|nr:unnamed protein product [Peniophora sp. CBMAI 1063]
MGSGKLSPRLWNECVDAIPRYRAMKEKKKTEEFCREFCKELVKKYPGVDVTYPGDTPFRKKIRNWFGNQGRLDRRPQKVSVPDPDDDEEERKPVPKARRRIKKEKPTTLEDMKKVTEMFTTKKKKHAQYDAYYLENLEKGLKERADQNWAVFSPLLPEGTDLAVARAQFNHQFAAMELANQMPRTKQSMVAAYKDAKTEDISDDAVPFETRVHLQELVEFADNQQVLRASCQAIVNALFKHTGLSCTLLIGGCDIMNNGGLWQDAYSTQHPGGQKFLSSKHFVDSDIQERFKRFLESDVFPSGVQRQYALFPDAPQRSLGFTFGVIDHLPQGEDEDSDSGLPPTVETRHERDISPPPRSLSHTLTPTANTRNVVAKRQDDVAEEEILPNESAVPVPQLTTVVQGASTNVAGTTTQAESEQDVMEGQEPVEALDLEGLAISGLVDGQIGDVGRRFADARTACDFKPLVTNGQADGELADAEGRGQGEVVNPDMQATSGGSGAALPAEHINPPAATAQADGRLAELEGRERSEVVNPDMQVASKFVHNTPGTALPAQNVDPPTVTAHSDGKRVIAEGQEQVKSLALDELAMSGSGDALMSDAAHDYPGPERLAQSSRILATTPHTDGERGNVEGRKRDEIHSPDEQAMSGGSGTALPSDHNKPLITAGEANGELADAQGRGQGQVVNPDMQVASKFVHNTPRTALPAQNVNPPTVTAHSDGKRVIAEGQEQVKSLALDELAMSGSGDALMSDAAHDYPEHELSAQDTRTLAVTAHADGEQANVEGHKRGENHNSDAQAMSGGNGCADAPMNVAIHGSPAPEPPEQDVETPASFPARRSSSLPPRSPASARNVQKGRTTHETPSPPQSTEPALPPVAAHTIPESIVLPADQNSIGTFQRDYDNLRSLDIARTGDDDRSSWDKLIDVWMTFEKQNGFRQGNTRIYRLSTGNRPMGVKEWVDNRRRDPNHPIAKEKNSVSFSQSWRKWYLSLQPSWRDTTSWPLEQPEAHGEFIWLPLRKYGPTGVTQLLFTLGHWATLEPMPIEVLADWRHAIKDLTWVLEQMIGTFPRYLKNIPNEDKKSFPAAIIGVKRKSSENDSTENDLEPVRKR